MKTESDNITLTQLAETLEKMEITVSAMGQAFEALSAVIAGLAADTAQLVAQSDTRKKLSEAGKRSAAARLEKFGSADPRKKEAAFEIRPEPQRVPIDLFGAPAEQVHEGVQRKKHKRESSQGTEIWAAYSMAYRNRYGINPVRNAKINGQCLQLAKSVGVEDGRELVAYYLTRNDAFYVRASHPLGLCVIDIQKLKTERYNGNVVTMADARRIESGSATDRALQEYAAAQSIRCRACNDRGWYVMPGVGPELERRRKCGCSEQAREGVHAAEVLQ